MSRVSYANQVRVCGVSEEEATVSGEVKERTRGKVPEYRKCGSTLSYSNIARLQRSCRVCDPGFETSS